MAKITNSWLVVNYTCNNRCSWCYAENNIKVPKIMPYELAIKSLNILKGIGAKKVIMIGGEPTLYKNLNSLIKYAKEQGLGVGMVTNGRRLADKRYLDSLLETGIGGLTISIHGSNPETHENTTNSKGSFEQTVQGIKNYCKAGKIVSTSTTISESNMQDLEDIVKFLAGIGVRSIGFTTCAKAPDTNPGIKAISPKNAAKIIERLYLLGKEVGAEVRSVTPLPLCDIDEKIREEMLSKGAVNYSCQMHHGSGIAIDPDGNILPCVHWSNYPIGSVLKENGELINAEEFYQFWNDKKLLPARFRESLWRYPSISCKNSKYWGECIGGCPSFWTDFDPEKEIKGLQTRNFRWNRIIE